MNTITVFIFYFAFVNFMGFYTMYDDKMRSKKRAWRIPETTFFTIALIGGCIGCITGMYFFHHKTKHLSFVLGLPLILMLQIAGIFLLKLTPIEIKLL